MILWIEFTDGSTKEVYADDITHGKQCLNYLIRYGPDRGEYNIPYCQIKIYKIVR